MWERWDCVSLSLRIARRTKVNIVSYTNGQTTRRPRIGWPPATADLPPSNGKTAKLYPRNALPTSPMKILAGGQFKQRNPKAAEARETPNKQMAIFPDCHATRAQTPP